MWPGLDRGSRHGRAQIWQYLPSSGQSTHLYHTQLIVNREQQDHTTDR